MSRPSELHKAVATDLATLLPITEENKQKAFDLMEKLGYTQQEKEEAATNSENSFESHVGIYKPEIKDGKKYYHRDISLKDRWSYFADVQIKGFRDALVRFRLGVNNIATYKNHFIHNPAPGKNDCIFCIGQTENERHVLFH